VRDRAAPEADGGVLAPVPDGDGATPVPVAAPAEGRAAEGGETGERILVFDLETQRGADEVGGWGRIDRMGLAVAVVYDISQDLYSSYFETDVDRLLLDLVMADVVVGFNVDRFDLRVLSAYTRWDLRRIHTFDLLADIHRTLGFRLSLDHLARENLGMAKSADGLQSLRWWREGKIREVEEYCRRDVEVTWRLYSLGVERGWLVYRDRDGRRVRLPVSWSRAGRRAGSA
jgi:DEAD/DEAH box helicase domain-containing protein